MAWRLDGLRKRRRGGCTVSAEAELRTVLRPGQCWKTAQHPRRPLHAVFGGALVVPCYCNAYSTAASA